MTETVYSFFENNAVPVVGIIPSIVGIDGSNNENLFSGTMTEVGSGRYKYRIVNYNKGSTYLITVDGGETLPTSIRYQSVINELDAYPNKLDRRSISTRTINNDDIAKAVREHKGKIKEGTVASLICKDIDYKVIGLQFDDMKKEIAKIDFSKIKFSDYQGLLLKDIEKIISNNNKNDEINKLVPLLKSVQEMNTILQGECTEIKSLFDIMKSDVLSNIEGVSKKFSRIGLDDIIDDIKEIFEEIEGFKNIVEKLEEVPEIVGHYKTILDGINSNRGLEDKLIAIRLGVNDILSKIK